MPTGVAEKAEWYVKNWKTHVRTQKEGDRYVYWFLRKDNELGKKQISEEVINNYERTLAGAAASFFTRFLHIPNILVTLDMAFGAHVMERARSDMRMLMKCVECVSKEHEMRKAMSGMHCTRRVAHNLSTTGLKCL